MEEPRGEAEPVVASWAGRNAWGAVATLGFVAAALAGAFGGMRTSNVLAAVAATGTGAVGAVAAGLYEAGLATLAGLATATGLTATCAVGAGIEARRGGGHSYHLGAAWFALLGAGLALASPLLLWATHRYLVAVMADDTYAAGEIATVSARIATLLIATVVIGLVAAVAAALSFLLSSARSVPVGAGRVHLAPVAWGIAAAILLLVALGFHRHLRALHRIAVTGAL